MRRLLLGMVAGLACYAAYRLGYRRASWKEFVRSAAFLRAHREFPNSHLMNPTYWVEVEDDREPNPIPTNGGTHGGCG